MKSEFKPTDPKCRPGYVWKFAMFNGVEVPEGSRTVRTFFPGGPGAQEQETPPTSSSTPTSSSRVVRALPTRACLRDIRTLEVNDVYIGREHRSRSGWCLAASKWANPYKVWNCRDATDAVDKYEAHLRASRSLMNDIDELGGRRLVCHCGRLDPCHADAIIRVYAEKTNAINEVQATVVIGIYREKEKFVEDACGLEHPFEAHFGGPAVVSALAQRMSTSTQEIIQHRRGALRWWTDRARALAADEKALHASLDPETENILGSKSLLVFRELLEHIGFPRHDELFFHFKAGFPVAGDFPVTEVFPAGSREATMTIDDLRKASKANHMEILAMTRSSGDASLDKTVFDITTEEVAKGWLAGPYELDDLKFLGDFTLSRRFGIVQGEKVRPIDDYSVSNVNSALASAEAIDPADIDQICANARLHADALCIDEEMRHVRSPFFGIKRHADLKDEKLFGRIYDIASAYKQLAVLPSQRHLTVVAVFDPSTGQPKVFRQLSLPFGAAAAVLAFNWVATSLCAILQNEFLIGATHFYDDFTVLEREGLIDATDQVILDVFALLGWELKPLPEFSQVPEPLGAILDLREAKAGTIVISNQAKRIKELVTAIEDIRAQKVVDGKLLEKIRGRILFCRSLCFGRFAAMALRILNAECAGGAHGRGQRRALSDDCSQALALLARAVRDGPPRRVLVAHSEPLLLFSDGACEPAGRQAGSTADAVDGTIGGVLLDRVSGRYLFFGGRLAPAAMAQLGAAAANPIAAVELIAIWVALLLWGDRCAHRPVLAFIDNDPARHALVRGGSPVPAIASVVDAVCDLEIRLRALAFFERVPSQSNIADPPSRGVRPDRLDGFEPPEACDCTRVGDRVAQSCQLLMGLRDTLRDVRPRPQKQNAT